MKPEEVKITQAALEFIMPWGKFKGTKMDLIPSGYIKWLARECDNDDIATKASLVDQWRDRIGGQWYD